MPEPVVRVCRIAEVPRDPGLLTEAEVRRVRRLVHRADREAYRAAHVLARLVAAELAGVAAASVVLVQRCPSCGATDHGRPAVAGMPHVHVSLSHTRGVVAAVAATTVCGIDAETVRARVPVEALTDRERRWVARQPDPGTASVALWVRKEAWAKASGEGLDQAMSRDVLDAGWLTGEVSTAEYAAAWVVLADTTPAPASVGADPR
ncbi:4'-phosphopantetheinyl transferase superfamily protein [Nocardioides sp. BP30]|uniref:4'-phosphopantetheinyl transferase family protein n=1 Tax=Nocardioides sp. BP30 TaxID=3036374 RepID=UPI002468584A|nr:4'-phosphopantetheinyl transferase superfamily protein [Nocardioides sp. BP30]WGL50348.1 4'-phosphopantetheinyl transferase superfamily protein [Nocardioides sp. BP30]